MQSIHIDHGNPMNAILDTPYTRAIQELGENIAKPDTIIIISAHFMSDDILEIGTNPNPEMIYDMYGFPDTLYGVQYPVAWDVLWAKNLGKYLESSWIKSIYTPDRGIDHGIWSILVHLFPHGDVPIIPLSVTYRQGSEYHVMLGEKLRKYSEWKNILFLSSGNIVHNLRELNWNTITTPQWASDFDTHIETYLKNQDYQKMIQYQNIPGAEISIPTPDHLYPFLTFVGTLGNNWVEAVFQWFELGSISTRIYKML